MFISVCPVCLKGGVLPHCRQMDRGKQEHNWPQCNQKGTRRDRRQYTYYFLWLSDLQG